MFVFLCINRCYEGDHALEEAMNAFSSDASFEIIYRPKYLNLSLPEEGVLLVDYFTEKFGADKAKKYMEETPKYMANLVCKFCQLELWLDLLVLFPNFHPVNMEKCLSQLILVK